MRTLLLLVAVALAGATGASSATAAPPPPSISAPSAIVVEISTGDVAYARRPDERRSIASVTKLMTALLTLEAGHPLTERVPATRYRASAAESRIDLRPGERLTTKDMLRGLLLASANDAAVALAEHGAGSRRAFVREMNRRARRLGLRSTRFSDPIGLGAGDQSTARELVSLTLQLRRFPFFKRTVDRAAATLRSGGHVRQIVNRNTLVREIPSVSGVKTGHTSRAGYVLVASATRRGITLVSVVLGTPTEAARNADTRALLDFGFSRYSRRRAVARGAVLARAPIRYRRGATLDLVAERTVRRVVRRGGPLPRARVASAPEEVDGPIHRGQRLGSADILVGRDRVASVALVAGASVPAAGAAQKVKDSLTRPLGFGLALAVVAGTVALVMRRRSRRSRPPRSRRSEPAAT
jgi:serine-type D-Ala-D-Ala carboxypeptidase (penicillin-binding protein 5/6)